MGGGLFDSRSLSHGLFNRFGRPTLLQIEQSFETRIFPEKSKLYGSCRAVTLFCDDQFRKAGILVGRLINFFAINEHHQIRILLNRAGFTKIRKLRLVIALAPRVLLGFDVGVLARDWLPPPREANPVPWLLLVQLL